MASIDYSPMILLKPFRFHLTVDTLSSKKSYFFLASKELPPLLDTSLWPQAEWDFNPPETCAAKRTLRLTPPPLSSFCRTCVVNTCIFNTAHVSICRTLRVSQVPSRIFTNSPTSQTPVVGYIWIDQFDLIQPIACYDLDGIGFHIDTSFEALSVHPFGFRLECFAVYASSVSLPRQTQDSLYGGTGFPFHNGTFTRKIRATYPGAPKMKRNALKCLLKRHAQKGVANERIQTIRV